LLVIVTSNKSEAGDNVRTGRITKFRGLSNAGQTAVDVDVEASDVTDEPHGLSHTSVDDALELRVVSNTSSAEQVVQGQFHDRRNNQDTTFFRSTSFIQSELQTVNVVQSQRAVSTASSDLVSYAIEVVSVVSY